MVVDHVRGESARLTETFLTDATLERLLGVVDVSATIHRSRCQ